MKKNIKRNSEQMYKYFLDEIKARLFRYLRSETLKSTSNEKVNHPDRTLWRTALFL